MTVLARLVIEITIDEAPVPWDATRTLLPRIGWLTDEILRTSEEKINLAQTIYETARSFLPMLCFQMTDLKP